MTLFRTILTALAGSFALLATASAFAAEPAAEPTNAPANAPATAPAPAAARPALWKVSDHDTTIYLFGTIHALPPGIDWYNGTVAAAFSGSQELVTEVANVDPTRLQSFILQTATLPKGKTLRGQMSRKGARKYAMAMAGLSLPPAAFDRYEAWYAAIGLSTLPMARAGFSSESGVEHILEARARTAGMAHSGLETPEYQLGLFDSLPAKTQQRYLLEVIDSLPSLRDQVQQMVAAWHRGDADTLARLMNSKEDDPALIETLLLQRNRAWSVWVQKRMARPGTVFLAVGAGHLAGTGSLQDQLDAAGVVSQRVQ